MAAKRKKAAKKAHKKSSHRKSSKRSARAKKSPLARASHACKGRKDFKTCRAKMIKKFKKKKK